MQNKKHPKLPRGLRWRAGSQTIWFTWRDAKGAQYQKSTELTDPDKALLFKIQFLERQEQNQEDPRAEVPDLARQHLGRVATLFFEWKVAKN